MSEFRVTVVHPHPGKKRESKRTKMWRYASVVPAFPLEHPVKFLALCFAVFLLSVGTPHIGRDYECRHKERNGACRYYGYCAYYGIQGRRILFAEECGSLVKFIPIDWGKLWPFEETRNKGGLDF